VCGVSVKMYRVKEKYKEFWKNKYEKKNETKFGIEERSGISTFFDNKFFNRHCDFLS
jgi:hypothetical protein